MPRTAHQPGLFADVELDAPRARLERGAKFARVALNLPVRTEFTYVVPSALVPGLVPGMRVQVPFSSRREIGVVVDVGSETDVGAAKLREIAKRLDEEPVVDATLLGLTRWIADEYVCSWGEALAAVLPSPLKHGRHARTVRVVRAAPGAAAALGALEHKREQQFRVLRTLLDLDGAIELRELCRKLNVGTSPIETLATNGLALIERIEKDIADLLGGGASRVRPAALTDEQEQVLAPIRAAVDARRGAAFLLHG
ncbi:MAG: hypothetical protein EPO68_02720, partial [Planctomycetota bacterium]